MPGIVVGVDNSTHSQRALEWAISEAGIRQLPLTVVTVLQEVVYWSGRPALYPQDYPLAAKVAEAVQEQVDATLDKVAGPKPGPESVTVRSVPGSPSVEILMAATDADMIVLGSRGAGGFTKLLMGSVSTQVAHHAHCPVVIIPPEDRN